MRQPYASFAGSADSLRDSSARRPPAQLTVAIPFLFGIEIDHGFCGQAGCIQIGRANQSDLFLNRKYAFQRRVYQTAVREHRQHHGNCNTVVSAERCSFGTQITAADFQGNPVRFKIVDHICVFFAYQS